MGLGILGHALGRRAGLNYAHAVRDLVCTPLGLADTTARPSDEQAPRVLTGHDAHGRPVPTWGFPSLPGAGALSSSARDLLRFLDANLGSGPLAEALTLTHLPRVQAGRRRAGLGWLISKGPRGPLLWQSSALGGFSGFLGFSPATDTGVVLLSDHGRSRLDALLHHHRLEREGLRLLAQ